LKELEQYYGKFNEEKRLLSRHGRVEYEITMKYIHDYLQGSEKILEIGAGTGRYSVALAGEGYDVTAVEPVKSNLGVLKAKKSTVKAIQANALNLKKLPDETFDRTLLFGPMYHLFTREDKLTALREAKRVTKQGGILMVAYCMNDYGVIMYGFGENQIQACLSDGRLSADFHCHSQPKDLYDYVRLEDIDSLNSAATLCRKKIVAVDGAANYIRPVLKRMDEETFQIFIQYQLSIAERPDLIGASAHTLDILEKI